MWNMKIRLLPLEPLFICFVLSVRKLTVGPCLDTDVLESMLTMGSPFETACVHTLRTKQITFDLTLERSSCESGVNYN